MSRAVSTYFESINLSCSLKEKELITEAADDFSNQVAIDVKNFVLQLCLESWNQSPRKIIVFPEVNDLGEILIDEIVRIFPNLVSFVVGSPKSKRIVVCSHDIVKNKVLKDLDNSNCDSQDSSSISKVPDAPITDSVNSSMTTKPDDVPEEDGKESKDINQSAETDPSVTPPPIPQSSTVNNNEESLDSSPDCTSQSVESKVASNSTNRSSANTTKPRRLEGGIFRRVMTELYIAADRERGGGDSKTLSSNLNSTVYTV